MASQASRISRTADSIEDLMAAARWRCAIAA